jgi:uncharacterized protein YndB with AHSA1/START domain
VLPMRSDLGALRPKHRSFEILRRNMIDIEMTTEIARPVRDVFTFVADHTNAPQWQEGLHEVRRLTAEPVGKGSEHAFVRRFAGREIISRNRFVAFEEDRFVEFEVPDGWLTGVASYRTEPSTSGTLLTSRMQFQTHGPARLFEPVLARILARDSRRDQARLKALLEEAVPAPA